MKPRGLLSLHSRLHTLRLHPLGFTGDCEEFLVDLPASVRRVSHKGWGMYPPDKPSPDKPVSGQLTKHISTVAKQLTELSLTDVRSLTTRCLVPRGVFDKLVRRLVAVRRLSINPTAVSHLSELLAPLEFLTELELLQGESISLEPLSYHETVLFVTRARALRTISISQVSLATPFRRPSTLPAAVAENQIQRMQEIRAQWSAQQAGHIEHEAARKGVTVLWPVRIK